MGTAYSIPKAKAQRKLLLQVGLLGVAAAGSIAALLNLAHYWVVLIACAGIAALAVRNIHCWLRVFSQNAGRDPLQVRH